MQLAIVMVLVIAATVFAVWKLMPARRQLRLLMALDAWLARKDFLQDWRVHKLAPRIQATGSGCAGCAANVGHRSHPRR
jgi:hypothetical protein